MKRILVTGRKSFLGTSLTDYLRGDKRYDTDCIDLRDKAWRDRSLGEFDSIFYVAGIAHSDMYSSRKEKENYYKINVDLAAEVAKKAKMDGIKQFIFMSSSTVYGESTVLGRENVITKSVKPAPQNDYGCSKLAAEEKILKLEDDKFRVCIIRSPMVYGKGCKGNYPKLRKLALLFPLFPKVGNQRSMIYVDNLSEFVRLLIENNDRGVFCPQNAEYVNTSELVGMIAEVHGKRIRMINGFEGVIRFMGIFSKASVKAFGNMSYDMEMSFYRDNYRVYSLKESIVRTESR